MKKTKRGLSLSDWLILGMAGLIDFLQDIRDPLGIINNYYQTYFGYVPSRFRKSSFSNALWRALKNERIKRFIKKGKVFYYLSPKSKKEIRKKYLLLTAKKRQWDRKWRLVIFDIEEANKKRREYFRKSLKEIGFGMLQKSVWISPHNFFDQVKNLIINFNLEKEVILIETDNLYTDDYINLAKKIWPIEKLNNKYQNILKKINKIDLLKNKSDRIKKLSEIKKEIIDIYFKDPHLPKELLPKNWYGYQLFKKVKKLKIF